MYVRAHVTAGAKKELVKKISETEFDICVREPAERNLANGRVRILIAAQCGVREKDVRMVSGHRSPTKVFTVEQEGS